VEHIGHYLWEGSILLTILFAGTSLLVLRRKTNGRPAFTDQDRKLFFGDPETRRSKPRFWINFSIAVLLSSSAGALEYLLLARFGAAILAAAALLTLLAIVKKWLC
jgi:hypothetical protein